MPNAREPREFKEKISNNYFQGGVSVSRKLAVANSYYYSEALDNRTDPAQLSVLPGLSTIYQTTANGLITAIAQDESGVRWTVDTNGTVGHFNTANVWSMVGQMSTSGAAGMFYNLVTDALYIPTQNSVSMVSKCTGSSTFRESQFGPSASVANGCINLYDTNDNLFDGDPRNNSQSAVATGITQSVIEAGLISTNATKTYIPLKIIDEGSGNYCFFAPDIEPFHSVWVYIIGAGTGDWTLTLHDSLNDNLASVTVTNSNIVANTYNEFKFPSQVRAIVNASQTGNSATYHWHVTTTTGDGTIGTLSPSDCSTADFLLFAYRLVAPNNGWHPAALFVSASGPQLCIGNSNYLSTYNFGNDSNPNNSQWSRHTLQFDMGYEVCGLSTNNQTLAIAAEKRSTISTHNYQDGYLYFWDGSTNAPAIKIEIPMGAPYGLYTFNGVTYFACSGSLFAWSGGQTTLKVRKLAYQNTDYLNMVDTTIVNPNMFTSRYNILMMGYPSSTTNPNINYGVWSWGTSELTFPNSYGLSYLLANGYLNNLSPISNLQIGCVYNFVDSMYVPWSYTDSNSVTHYGVDFLNNSSLSALNFKWHSLTYDGGAAYHTKLANRLKISFIALPAGATVTGIYSLERGPWQDGQKSATTGDVGLTVEINQRFHEVEYGFQGTTSGTSTPPVFTNVVLEVDTLEDQTNLTAGL